jgi:hypothetical protein
MNWSLFAVLALSTAAIHWIIARSTIMRWFWDAVWLPTFLDELLACTACSGFWLGLGLGALGLRPFDTGHLWLDVLAAGGWNVVGMPVVEGVLLWGLDRTRID